MFMGAPTWPPSPHTFGPPRRRRDAPLIASGLGAPTWPPSPHTFGPPRRRRDAPLIASGLGAPTWPPSPHTFGPSRRRRDAPLVASDHLRCAALRQLDGISVADERGTAHVARLVGGERARAVHGLAVVPHDQITHTPAVRVHELPLGGVLDEVAQERAGLGDRPADDPAGVRREVERLALRDRVRAHERLAYRREARALLVGEVGEPELLAREDLRVL